MTLIAETKVSPFTRCLTTIGTSSPLTFLKAICSDEAVKYYPIRAVTILVRWESAVLEEYLIGEQT
jgi:hypothetical protein